MAAQALTLLVSLFTVTCFAQAEPLNSKNILGDWQAEIIDPSGQIRDALGGLESYLIEITVLEGGTISYTEFHNPAKTQGILGTPDIPACPGTWHLKDDTLYLTIDCSLYSTVYSSKINLKQATPEQLLSSSGLQTTIETTLLDGPMDFIVKKIR